VRNAVLPVLATSIVAGTLTGARPASGEGGSSGVVRWDVAAEAGAWQRFVRGGEPGAPRPGVGPGAALLVHVALVPMVRVGAYVAYDLSPIEGRSPREYLEGGLRLKVTPPIFGPPWRAWIYTGVGAAWSYQPSYTVAPAPMAPTPTPASDVLPGAAGGLLELPFGVGLGYRLRKEWTVFAELGGRASLLAWGGMEQAPVCLCRDAFVGKDSFAVGLSVGVSWGQ
jgi:hypothetical protein